MNHETAGWIAVLTMSGVLGILSILGWVWESWTKHRARKARWIAAQELNDCKPGAFLSRKI